MPGFDHDPLADVDAIRQLLEGYKTGYPFLKEALQNAHDAGASKVWFQWHRGLGPEAGHPLLRGPALIIVNDGPFDDESQLGIKLIGLSNRAADTERIGRFGLGIKSLFHVCEGFFYMESNLKESLRGFLTPWHASEETATKYHRSWWSVSADDWQRMVGVISNALPKTFDPWFGLWIPLRIAPRTGGIEAIRADCPGASIDHCHSSIISAFDAVSPSLAESMVFLDRLQSVEFHDGQTKRLSLRRESEADVPCSKIGESKFWISRFNNPNQPQVQAIQANERWPQVSDRRTGGQAKDKASWQGGIAVSQSPRGESKSALRVFWSVFLPVGNKPVMEIPLRHLEANLHIFLHGYFFPNRDRTFVFGAEEGFRHSGPDSEDALKQEWNRMLAMSPDGVLARFIPTLEEYFDAEAVDESAIEEIIRGLSGDDFFKIYRSAICHDLSYARALTKEGWSWQRLSSEAKLFTIPRIERPMVTVERILFAVTAPAKRDRAIVINDQAYLSHQDFPTVWSVSDLRWFCDCLDTIALGSHEDAREFVRSLLAHFHATAELSPEAWQSLPLYKVYPIKGPHQFVSTTQLLEWQLQSCLFCQGDAKWSTSLQAACPEIKLWLILGALPPGLVPPVLDLRATALLVLSQPILAAHGNRLQLVQRLLDSIRDQDMCLAARYLMHGSFEHRRDGERLYFCSSEQASDPWGQMIRIILHQKGESWRTVHADFANCLSPDQASALFVAKADSAVFRELCGEDGLELSSLPLAPFHDFLMLHLEGGTQYDPDSDKKLLRRLRIHDCGQNEFTVIDEHSWLAPDTESLPPQNLLPMWNDLCQKARIVGRSDDLRVILRQKQIFERQVLDTNGIICLICTQANSEAFAPLIVFCLGQGNPTAEARKLLLEAAWLPIRGGGTAKIEQLLWMENADDELDELVRDSQAKGFVVTRRMLNLSLHDRENKGAWNTLSTQLIPKGDAALALLGLAFETSTRLHLGVPVRNADELAEWLRAIDGVEWDFSRASRLIRKLWPNDDSPGAPGARVFAEKVASVFARPWQGDDANLYDNALEALRQRHHNVEASLRVAIAAVFCRYLGEAFNAGIWTRYRIQEDFLLLNQRGEWKSVRDLVRPCAGLDAAFLVDTAQASALGLRKDSASEPDQPGEMDVAESAEATAKLLEAYGKTLSNLHHRHWGSFVALFGDDKPVRLLAEKLTEDMSGYRVRLIPSAEARDKLSNLHFRCTLLDGTSVEMQALNGDLINVPVSSMKGSFLVPDRHGRLVAWEISGNQHIHRIRLLSPERFRDLSSADLLDKLELTIRQLLDSALETTPSDLGAFFNQIVGLQEQSLGVAQQSILIGAEMHLQQLAWRKLGHAGLTRAFKLLEESKELEARARQQEIAGYAGHEEPLRNHQESARKREGALATLEPLLREDGDLNRALSNAMRRKIGESGYVAESISFEIFQNADDAVGELSAGRDVPPVFVAEFCPDVVRFAHWGRVINATTNSDETWMRQDLVKMILLNGSDKFPGNSEARPTGKFGLGFKSVYLVCEQPRVISGALEFEVRGATYPARLPPDDATPLRNWLSEQIPTLRVGTVFELPLSTRDHTWQNRFRILSGYLPLFARHLKEIRIVGHEPATHQWSITQRIETERCVIEIGSGGDTGRLLKLSSVAGGLSWMFGWSNGGFQKLPASVPSLWITAPTRTRELGIVLNGPFEPDPGRVGLGSGSDASQINAALFADAAILLADGLNVLTQGEGATILAIEDGGISTVWHSAWDLFSSLPTAEKDKPAAHDEIVRAVWSPDCHGGYAHAVANHRVIPNGMPGAFENLTSIALISYRTTGYLEHIEGKALIEDMGAWPEWQRMEPEKVIEPTRIATTTVVNILQRHLGSGTIHTDDISLRFILHRLLGDGRVTERLAALLGSHLSEQTFTRGHGYQWPFEEERDTRAFLEALQFLNADGEWAPSRELLSGGQPDYEPLRAAFAPAMRLLANEYGSPQAQRFFRLCRGDMQVTAEEMADWIRFSLNQEDGARVAASLRFLASGDGLTSSCAGHLSLTERNGLLNHVEFPQLEPDDQNRIKQTFNIADAQKAKLFGLEMTWNPRVDETGLITEPSVDLEDLINEWEGHEHEAIQRFTLSGHLRPLVFPDVIGDDNLRERLLETESIKGRASWYRLLCLGCALSLTLGRTPYDRIMRFWEQRLGDDFWLATIPESLEGATSPRFEQRLDKFFEDIIHRTFRDENASGEEADFWRRVFYDFRKMHFFVFGESNLPALILQIASSDGVGGGQLVQFLRSGHVPPSLQTPGHERWAGVVGQSMSAPLLFVMRELRRLRVLPDGFESACYYMNSPARRIASRLGWIEPSQQGYASFADLLDVSETVYRAIQEHAPELAPHFDLPLQWFAHQNL